MLMKPLAGNAREVSSLRQEAFDMLKQVIREALLLLFLDFDIVMQELDLQLRRQLLVERLPHKIAVLGGHSFFPIIGRFRQIKADKGKSVLLKAPRKVLAGGYSAFVEDFVKDDVWLGQQWVWLLSPKEWD